MKNKIENTPKIRHRERGWCKDGDECKRLVVKKRVPSWGKNGGFSVPRFGGFVTLLTKGFL